MASVEDFLSSYPEYAADDGTDTSTGDIRLDVTLLGITAAQVRFTHLGTDYSVDRADVVSIEPAGERPADRRVVLTLTRDAALAAVHAVAAESLTGSVPFGMRKPLRPRAVVVSDQELAWRVSSGYTSRYPSLETYLSAFATYTRCDSHSAGILDDTLGDDEREDY
ncbi:hypothetical protein ACWFNE_00805 [Cellulomonas sp. NPDC055163]